MSSRVTSPAASPACNASPTSRSFRYRSAQSKCRNPASSASLVAVTVTAGSGIRVPNPSAGMWLVPLLSAIFFIRKSEVSATGDLEIISPCCTARLAFDAQSQKQTSTKDILEELLSEYYGELGNSCNAGGLECSGSSKASFPCSGLPLFSIGGSRLTAPKPPNASNRVPRVSCEL